MISPIAVHAVAASWWPVLAHDVFVTAAIVCLALFCAWTLDDLRVRFDALEKAGEERADQNCHGEGK